MRENLIVDVRDYLNGDIDLAVECLEHIGECDWAQTYSLDELYSDYFYHCLADCINSFLSSCDIDEVDSCDEYIVKDGEVKYAGDIEYYVEELLDDDDIVTQIIAEIDYGNIDVPDDLYKMCHVVEWATIKDAIDAGYSFIMNNLYSITSAETFEKAVCTGSFLKRIRDCLVYTKVFGATADDYEILKEMVWENVIPNITVFCRDFCKGGVTVEKATEVWIKKNVLEG